jgi:hypothetical protein
LCTLYIVVCFIVIMFSSTLNLWTKCTQIYQDTSALGAGGWFRSVPAKIWTNACSVCWLPPLTCPELSASCQLSVGGRLPLRSYTINAQARPISNPVSRNIH